MASSVGGSVVWNLDVDDSQFRTGLAAAGAEAKAFGAQLNNIDVSATLRNVGGAFGSIANAIQRTTLLAGTFGAVLGGVFVKSAADLQQTSRSFEVLIGNTQTANKLFAKLAQFANTTPFEFPDIAKAAQTLLGFGINADRVFGDIKTLGDIAAATGADFKSLAVVFGQVNATGKLMGQDALQLINNNIPITTILAKKLGTTVQTVKQRMEDGAISAALFNEALLQSTQKGGFAFQGTAKLADTLNGRLSTLKDAVLEFGRNLLGVKVDPSLGLTVQPGGLFDRLSALVPKITASLAELAPKIVAGFDVLIRNGATVKAVILALAAAFVTARVSALAFAAASSIAGLVSLIGQMRAATGVAQALGIALNSAIGGNVFALAVTALVAAFVFLQARFNILGKAAQLFASFMTTAGDAISSSFKLAKVATVDLVNNGIKLLSAGLNILKAAFDSVKATIAAHRKGLEQIAGVITVVLGPAFIRLAVQAGVAGARMAAGAVVAAAQWVLQAARIGVAWTAQFAIIVARSIATAAAQSVQATRAAAVWIARAVGIGAVWVAQFALMTARAIATAVVFVAQAAIAGHAWLIQAAIALPSWLATFAAITASAIRTAAVMAVQAVQVAAGWVAQFAVMSASAIATGAVFVAQSAVAAAGWIRQAIGVAAAWIAQFARMAAAAVATAAQFLISAARVAGAWLVALGPIGLVIAAIGVIAAGAFLIIKNWNAVTAFFGGLGRVVLASLGNIGGVLFNAGRDLVTGLLNGAKSMFASVGNYFGKDLPNAIVNKFKSALGIHSPSTVFAGLGFNIAEGLAQGIAEGQSLVSASLQDFGNGLVVAPNVVASGTASGATAGNITQNNTYNVFSEVDLEAAARDQAWRLRNA